MEDGYIRINMKSHSLCQAAIDWFAHREIVYPCKDEEPALLVRAETIQTLEQAIEGEDIPTFEEAISLFSDIAGQLIGLERLSLVPSHLHLSSISVAVLKDGTKTFIISPGTDLHEIRGDFIEINRPFKRHMFMAPDLVALKTLPSKLGVASATYSLGVIVYYCLAGTVISSDNKARKLLPIRGTPLSAAIDRTIQTDPTRRRLLYL